MSTYCPAGEFEELYRDLEIKAAIDVDATVAIIEALEKVAGGSAAGLIPAGAFPASPGLPGKTPLALAEQAARLRPALLQAPYAGRLAALRDSLYRYQSL